MIGPVQENETNTSVNAIKNIPAKLPMPALLSTLLDQDDGRFISKAPKKEMPNKRKMAKNSKLAIQFVANWFKAAGPKTTVIKKPSNVNINTIDAAYNKAFFLPSATLLLLLVVFRLFAYIYCLCKVPR